MKSFSFNAFSFYDSGQIFCKMLHFFNDLNYLKTFKKYEYFPK